METLVPSHYVQQVAIAVAKRWRGGLSKAARELVSDHDLRILAQRIEQALHATAAGEIGQLEDLGTRDHDTGL